MSLEPPPFQEAPRCDVCKCSFNTFRRRHHCRCCGRTLCHDHSSDLMALPQFGILTSVRVCSDCFNNSRLGEDKSQMTFSGSNSAADAVSRLDIRDTVDEKSAPDSEQNSVINVPECKCGMPLCICVASAPEPDPAPLQMHTTYTVQPQPSSRRKKMDQTPKNTGPSSNSSNPSSFFNPGHMTKASVSESKANYEVSGEGLREAIKNSDTAAVRKLLSEGVDANYCDKQGLSLLHLAALFNQTEIAFILMDNGANLEYKNQQGETALDCAPTTLQYRMKQKMENGA
ncbi:vacuolar protein sorting-associated protein 27-like [Papaver somniferum]|uniref:vacuolar protein sorting-associated protein 27-like n=1 Tax=Papaver somniferum TaxID=3469 RepID=UPI000E700591|nr:vacuolar protein sorting-associated protein 27-like [Papaver somniferum]